MTVGEEKDMVNHTPHYGGKIEVIDYIVSALKGAV